MSAERLKRQKGEDRPKKMKSADNRLAQPDTNDTRVLSDMNFPVVALGASAGGLEAFSQFLGELPKNTGIAFVLIQHLDPAHTSSLAELLSRQSTIPVREAREGDRLEPDHAYVIPPRKAMSVHGRSLKLEEQAEHPGLTHSVDLFFQSLANDVQERAAGVILSGTGNDGAKGARAIKAQQGLVIVQDPVTARYDGMPRAAIESGAADYILPPQAIAARLIECFRQSLYRRGEIRQSLKKDDPVLRGILSLVKVRTGRDFSGYKQSSINRRIEHRMAVTMMDNTADYLKFLRKNQTEIDALLKDFLIQVTSFFRDKEAFEALKREIGIMLKEKAEGSPLRAWVAGCSTGEEAYSIAMVLLECIQESGRRHEVQVFATDLDAEAIAFARAGAYTANIANDVSPERLEQFFSNLDSSYQIKKFVRECVVFAVHDLVADPPYSRVDVVSMRNLLIYFDADLQKKVLSMIGHCLNEGGLLFLGTSETAGEPNGLFTTRSAKWRVYRSLGNKNRLAAQSSALSGMLTPGLPEAEARPGDEAMLLLEALPPSVLVDGDLQVLYTHGDTSNWLRMSEGRPSASLLQTTKPELRSVMATLLHEASQNRKGASSNNLKITEPDGIRYVDITVLPASMLEGKMIVTFRDVAKPRGRRLQGKAATEAEHQLVEEELRRTRDALGATVEELKTANEELRSANEEYMSTNEELKSANEELETSREELQSVNEELTTLNTESQKKNEDLTALNDDMLNLLNATGTATIFLDEKLKIRRFTPAAPRIFKFIEGDVGRPVEDISSPLKDDVLVSAARQVMSNLIPVEREVQTHDDKWYSMRILPYRTLDNNISGVVVSLVDINRAKAALQYADSIIDTIREPMLVLDERLRVVSSSRAFYRTFRVKAEDTEGQLIFELGNRQWDIAELRKILKEVAENDVAFEGYRVEHDFPGIGRKVMLLNARRIVDRTILTQRILLAMEDITAHTGLEPYSQRQENPGGASQPGGPRE